MKWLISIWMLTAGMGVSYHVVAERQQKIKFFREMEQSLGQLAYYIYQWRMPMKEILSHMVQEETGVLQSYYRKLVEAMEGNQAENFGRLWKEQSNSLWREKCKARECWGRKSECEIKDVWTEAFTHMPMEPEVLKRELYIRIDRMKEYREAMEEGQVTVDGISHALPQPFIVIATQNPTGAAGTQLLPDSQMDRFLVRLSLGYPSARDEAAMVLSRQGGNPLLSLQPLMTRPLLGP